MFVIDVVSLGALMALTWLLESAVIVLIALAYSVILSGKGRKDTSEFSGKNETKVPLNEYLD